MVNFTFRPLCHEERTAACVKCKAGWPQSKSRRRTEEKNTVPQPGLDPRTVQYTASSLHQLCYPGSYPQRSRSRARITNTKKKVSNFKLRSSIKQVQPSRKLPFGSRPHANKCPLCSRQCSMVTQVVRFILTRNAMQLRILVLCG